MQLFMLWSYNVGEARYERCVICLDMTQSEYLFFLPSNMKLALGNRKIYLFSSQDIS